MRLPRVIVQRGGREQDVEAKVTFRFEAGSSRLEIESALEIVDVDVERTEQRPAIFVESGTLPRAFYEAICEGVTSEIARGVSSKQSVPALRIVIEAAVIHPVDCGARAHRDAGSRAMASLLDE